MAEELKDVPIPPVSIKRANIRKRNVRERSPDGSDTESTEVIKDLLELQKLRRKKGGICVDTIGIANGEIVDKVPADLDPMRTQAGGMVNMKALKIGSLQNLESGGQHIDIGTEFSAETQRRDEDNDMMKFIEEEMSRRKGPSGCDNQPESSRKITRPEDALLVVAEKYRREIKKNEEMLSQQMLSGIPEVDLGIEAKIRNIEATEEAKKRLMQKAQESTEPKKSPAGENVALDYVQHSRYNLGQYQPSTDPTADHVAVHLMPGARSSPIVPRPKTDRPATGAHKANLGL